MKIIIIAIAAILLSFLTFVSVTKSNFALRSQQHELRQLYEGWKIQFGKQTKGDEDMYRFAIFISTHEMIEQWNKEHQEHDDVKLGLNQFADLTKEEFRKSYLGYKKTATTKTKQVSFNKSNAVNTTLDWRTLGAVSSIKNQGQCGACWAFSATAGLEGAWFLNNGTLFNFSEQQIVDCDTVDAGCNGGDLPTAFNYVFSAGGLELYNDYPYNATDNPCQFNKNLLAFFANTSDGNYAYQQVQANSGEDILQAANLQPVPVCIEADQNVFQYYQSGMIKEFTGCGIRLDHCVEIVGFDFSNTTYTIPYWIVKNSWGTAWGQQGYVNIEYNPSGYGTCGINEEAVYPYLP